MKSLFRISCSLSALALLLVINFGCGSSSDSGSSDDEETDDEIDISNIDDTTPTAGTLQITFATAEPSAGSTLIGSTTDTNSMALVDSLYASVGLGAEGLQSFKVYFREIKICESIEDTGSGYTNPTGCVSILENFADDYTGTEVPNEADRVRFTAAQEGKYYDLLSADDRAAMGRSIEVAPGNYNYGIIEMHPWVKIAAKSGDLCTKAAGAVEAVLDGTDGTNQFDYYTKIDSAVCGSDAPEEVLVYMVNGNSSFKFTSPFTVAAGDTVALDLAFNLDGVIKSGTDAMFGNLRDDTNGGFFVPMIDLGPAPRLTDDSNKIETYVFAIADNPKAKLRVELFYNAGDSTKAPLSMIGAVVVGDGSGAISQAVLDMSDATVADGVVSVKTYDGQEFMTFTRTDESNEATGSITCVEPTDTTGYPYGEVCAAGTHVLTDSDGPVIADLVP